MFWGFPVFALWKWKPDRRVSCVASLLTHAARTSASTKVVRCNTFKSEAISGAVQFSLSCFLRCSLCFRSLVQIPAGAFIFVLFYFCIFIRKPTRSVTILFSKSKTRVWKRRCSGTRTTTFLSLLCKHRAKTPVTQPHTSTESLTMYCMFRS